MVEGSALRVDLSSANVVTMYLLTSSNERLKPNLEKYLSPAPASLLRIPIKGWKPVEALSCRPARRSTASTSMRWGGGGKARRQIQ